MTADSLCPSEANEYIYSVIPTKEKYLRFEKGDHFIYSFDLTEDDVVVLGFSSPSSAVNGDSFTKKFYYHYY